MRRQWQLSTPGRGFTNITDDVNRHLADCLDAAAGPDDSGLCHIFIHHTSASLMISENADPDVLEDLEHFMGRLVPDGDKAYSHSAEGPDDMPAHIRSVLTQTHLTVPFSDGSCDLGTWQGLFLWEHRTHAHQRKLSLSVQLL